MDWLYSSLTFFIILSIVLISLSTISPKCQYWLKNIVIMLHVVVTSASVIPYGIITRNPVKTCNLWTYLTRYELRRCMRARTRAMCGRTTHTCDVQSHVCVCVRNPFWKACGMCARAALFSACDVRSHFCTLLYIFSGQNCQKCYILEHPFLLWNVLSCFGSSYSVLEHIILF